MSELNPRNLRDRFAPFLGKKVMIGTADWHYISGKVEALERTELHVSVNGKRIVVHAANVATIQEAPALQAEYVK